MSRFYSFVTFAIVSSESALLIRMWWISERKLHPQEIPHPLYVQNYSTATATCLSLQRWLFSLSIERDLVESDELAKSYIFWSTVEAVERNHILASDKLYQLKALQESGKKLEYLTMARTLPGYGEVVFPHCACDSRKYGRVILSVGESGVKLHACTEDGVLQVVCSSPDESTPRCSAGS